jgi:uncharacterized protein
MKSISILIKPASSLCNLRCKYCFYADEAKNRHTSSYGIMNKDTIDILINRIDEAFDKQEGIANISFQGGEPTIAGLDYFTYFVETLKKYPNIKTNFSIQTNGTLLNNKWSKFFKNNNFLIGVSLDGYRENTNLFRLDINNNGVYQNIINGIKILEKYQNEYNILTVLTRELAKHPKELFEFYKNNKFNFVQLIPCLPNMDNIDDKTSLTQNEYSFFYIEFFKLWKEEVLKGNFISINLFENIASILEGKLPYQCGMAGRCSPQFVLEANGDVFPCDFYCLDEYKLGNIKNNSFLELYKNDLDTFVSNSKCSNYYCKTCRFIKICNGGCRRQNICYLSNNSCAYQKVLEYIIPEMFKIFK